ncbi:hypothetical protein [Oscillatoria acuminata]|uniref:hypothetical protein n=1 Tax=Oscillatoria acuminata TaxID=118323 RepID=UPI0012E9FCCD|nr:hypothetical protein [Oscillatoria acuminata]
MFNSTRCGQISTPSPQSGQTVPAILDSERIFRIRTDYPIFRGDRHSVLTV